MTIVLFHIISVINCEKEKTLTDYQIFPNAPITEALLDIRVEFSKKPDLKTIEGLQNTIKERYPEKTSRHFLKAKFKFSMEDVTPLSVPTAAGSDGYLFRSLKEGKIVQSRLDGFTFNKLKPYENWDVFRDEAHELWKLYYDIVKPIRVVTIALRYINRIEIPLPFNDFGDYILTNPQVAPNLPQGLSHFFMRIQIPNDELQAFGTIIQTMENPTESRKLPLIFDIEVHRESNYDKEMLEMWDDFEKLRNFKNEIFFGSITDKTKELFE